MNLNPSRQVKIVNNNRFDHTEKFRGELVVIPKDGGSVQMIREDAVLFKSQFYQPLFDASGVQKAESYKMLKIEEIPEELVKDLPPDGSKFKCMACSKNCATEKLLKDHLKESVGCSAKLIDDEAQKELFGD